MHTKIERLKAIQVSACLLLALAAGCASKPDGVASERVREARLGLVPVGGVLPIDDFKTGPDVLQINTTGTVQKPQTGAGILGGTRCTTFIVGDNALGRPATVEIREGADGYLAVDTGVGVGQGMVVWYGFGNGNGQCVDMGGLNQDMSSLTGFQIEFATLDINGGRAAIDLPLVGIIHVWSGIGASNSSVVVEIEPGTTTQYVPFADFDGDVDWHEVRWIMVEIANHGSVFAHDYALRSISAVAQ